MGVGEPQPPQRGDYSSPPTPRNSGDTSLILSFLDSAVIRWYHKITLSNKDWQIALKGDPPEVIKGEPSKE